MIQRNKTKSTSYKSHLPFRKGSDINAQILPRQRSFPRSAFLLVEIETSPNQGY